MRAASTLAVAVILALFLRPVDASPPTYPCFHAEAPPAIDGAADDACWSTTPLATGFSVLGGSFTEAKQTAFRACWDDTALYFLIVCEEPDAAALRTDVRDGGDVWLNDGVEIFLQPNGQVYQFAVSASGARTSGAGNADFRQIVAAGSRGEASYTLEIAIPHTLIGATPDEGATWRGNVCRNIWTTLSGGDKFTSWAPLQRQFLEPQNFAAIDFRGAPPAHDAIDALTREINRGYHGYLVAQVGELAAQAPEYLPVLSRARGSDEHGRRASRLLYRWYRLSRMQAASTRYSIEDLRAMVQSAEELLSESYEVKYAWLISELFPD